MQGALTIFTMIFTFMAETPIMTLSVGEFSGSITFMQLFVGSAIALLGVIVVHKIMEW